MYQDRIVLKRSWAGEVSNVSLLVAIGMTGEGYREILSICEGAKEDKAGWRGFWLAGGASLAGNTGRLSATDLLRSPTPAPYLLKILKVLASKLTTSGCRVCQSRVSLYQRADELVTRWVLTRQV